MEIIYSDEAIGDRNYWIKSKNKKIQERITALIDSIEETPFLGIGKPEALKYNLSGCWSRRINREHRLIYTVSEDFIEILSMRGHY